MDNPHNRLIIVSNRLPYRIEPDEPARALPSRAPWAASWPGWSRCMPSRATCAWAGPDEPAGLDDAGRGAVRAGAGRALLRPGAPGRTRRGAVLRGLLELHAVAALPRVPPAYPLRRGGMGGLRARERAVRDAVLALARPGDTVWVHDYHLMLLPSLLREALPTPPSLLPAHPLPRLRDVPHAAVAPRAHARRAGRRPRGLPRLRLRAHFLSSCRRIVGVENESGTLFADGRLAQVDAFPRASTTVATATPRASRGAPPGDGTGEEKGHEGCKLMLSVEAAGLFQGHPRAPAGLRRVPDRFPEWRGRVVVCW